MNKCVICGLFRKWKELVGNHIPDSAYSYEQTYYECRPCLKKQNTALKTKILMQHQELVRRSELTRKEKT